MTKFVDHHNPPNMSSAKRSSATAGLASTQESSTASKAARISTHSHPSSSACAEVVTPGLSEQLASFDEWNTAKETCERAWLQMLDLFDPRLPGSSDTTRTMANGRRIRIQDTDKFPLGSRVLMLSEATWYRHAGLRPGIVVGKGRRFYKVLCFGPRTHEDASKPDNWSAVTITEGLLQRCTKSEFETTLLQCCVDLRAILAARRRIQAEVRGVSSQQKTKQQLPPPPAAVAAAAQSTRPAARNPLYARAMGLA